MLSILMRLSGGAKDFGQTRKIRGRQMAKLLAATLPHWVIHFLEQCQTRSGDPHLHHATILRQPLPLNQAALFELVEQAGDVRGLRDQAAGEGKRRKRARVFASQ
jgi:hypothetical protein